MEKQTFEQKIKEKGVTEVNCLIEIARQLKRIVDLLENKIKGVNK